MERFSQRESILLGYNIQNHRSSTNPSTPNRNSDVDFHDVFGGPPRRSSIQEMRYSLAGFADFSGSQTEEDAGSGSCAWPSGVREKPVFGEDNLNRRRYPNDNFYDDIFGGEESSPSCTPRKHERHPFSTAPGSRIMSPALPLPPAPDSIPPSSLLSTFSLPAKLTKGMDLPTFGSPARSLRKNIKDSSSDSPTTHVSRFSSHSTQSKEDLKNGSRPSRQSLLSQEFSDLSLADTADRGGDSAGHFHFSIYKWASKGVVPLVMPLRADRNSRTKENVKLERCSSAKDWIASESTSQNGSSLAYTGSSSTNNRKQVGSPTFTSPQKGADSRQFVEEIASAKPPLETISGPQNVFKDVPGSALSRDTQAESSNYSVSEVGFSGKMKGDSVYANEIHTPESKPLHSLFSEDHDEKPKWEKGKESKTKKSSAICDFSTNPKKGEKKIDALKGLEVSKAISQGSLSLDENMRNVGVKGKVKEFVRIFSQEALTKPGVDTKSRIQVSEYKLRSALGTKNDVEDNPEHFKKEDPATETTNISGDDISRKDDVSASAIPDSTVPIGDKDEFFHGNFLVKELAQDENEVLQTQDNQEIKVIDDKIRQWSNGKEGNIRSLLSTLQYVLWKESGWKPVPLVDIIEGNAVKRAYQRALLCLHPDKLQQKGAASHQKYIAEKVFDILQEAWTHSNMLGAL